jgi:integrase/recombinase XerC
VPGWFADFLIDRGTRKPSAHTVKAYRQNFHAIATLVSRGAPGSLAPAEITSDVMRRAFAHYAESHEPASIRRCWSTWNVLCEFLFTAGLIGSNPMPLVGRPKAARTLPRALPQTAVAALVEALYADRSSARRADWYERDLALILTALLAGLRSDELRCADVGDVRTSPTGAVLHVHGKGNKDRSVPVEPALLSVLQTYLDSRARRFPQSVKPGTAAGLSRWPARAPLFVGRDGARITRGTLESRVRRAFRRAGPDAQPVRGAMVHGLRHTFATELAEAEVSVYTLMKLLGHESMATSQRYVNGAARETRSAAARNPLYEVIGDRVAGPG